MIIRSLFIGIFIFLMALPVAAQGDEACEELVETALVSMAEHCTTFGNGVCVGFETVEVTSDEGVEITLSAPGDVAELMDIATLTLSPPDVSSGTWGIVVIHSEEYHMNMALFGGVTFQAPGILTPNGESDCEDVFAGAVLSAEEETTVTLNSVHITFAGTVIVIPQPDGELIITAYLDDVLVATDEGEVELEEGTSTEVVLDEDGLPAEAPTDPTETDTTIYDDLTGSVARGAGPEEIPYPEASGAVPPSGSWEMVRYSTYQYTACIGPLGDPARRIDQVPEPTFVSFDFSGGFSIPSFVEQQTGTPLSEGLIYDEPAAGVFHATDNRTSPPVEFTIYIVSETELVTSTIYYIEEPGGTHCGVINFNYWEYRGE